MMDYGKLICEIGLADAGADTFYSLHSRISEGSFRESVKEAYVAFGKGNEAFEEYLLPFSEREGVAPEHMLLYLSLVFSESALDELRGLDIDDEYFYGSLSDIPAACERQAEKNGIYGIPVFDAPWFRYALTATLFRLGRLQFQIAKSEYDLEVDGVKVAKGDRVFYVHVPKGGPLTPEVCAQSYRMGLDFFGKHYGDDKLVCFCYSWLLQPWIDEVLAKDTNIVKFKDTFKLIETIRSIPHTFRFIFPKEYDNLDDYPTDNPLRKMAVERRRSDKLVGYGVGVRLITEKSFL